MSAPKVQAHSESVAVGGDNQGTIVNAPGGTVNLFQSEQTTLHLTSLLGRVIVHFSQEELSHYAEETKRELTPEVEQKITYNYLNESDLVLRDYRVYAGLLEKSYRGVEQQNSDARRLVRKRAGAAYSQQLTKLCSADGIGHEQRVTHARQNSHQLVEMVIQRLFEDYAKSIDEKVDFEYAQLAVRLVVADAIVECEVLERPPNAAAA